MGAPIQECGVTPGWSLAPTAFVAADAPAVRVVAAAVVAMTMTMTHSEKSNICQMKAWPYRQECRGHDPTKKNLLCC